MADWLQAMTEGVARERIARAGLAEDVAALCARIDEGDDTALGPLSDALEEAGDVRAAGLRLVGKKRPVVVAEFWAWQGPGGLPESVGTATYRRLRRESRDNSQRMKLYSTRSAAFLALAAALAQ